MGIGLHAQSIWDVPNRANTAVFQLRCRGGAGYEFRSLGFRQVGQQQLRMAVAFVFASGGAAAGTKGEGLQPGTCAWVDRPLNSSEPKEVHLIIPAYLQIGIGTIDTSPSAAERHPDLPSMMAYLKDQSHYWSFTAFNTNNGYFDTTAHGYWKDFGAATRAQTLEVTPASTASWTAKASISNGFTAGGREVAVDGDGHVLINSTRGKIRCSAELDVVQIQRIEAAIDRSHPEKWLPSYALKSNPNGCCDQSSAGLHIERVDSNGRRVTHSTHWFNDSANQVPQGVSSLFDTIWNIRKACEL
jgi:hypothetical protein